MGCKPVPYHLLFYFARLCKTSICIGFLRLPSSATYLAAGRHPPSTKNPIDRRPLHLLVSIGNPPPSFAVFQREDFSFFTISIQYF
ncbi:hypothetical protein SLE2022_134630 [Rubroshorea leprosula]